MKDIIKIFSVVLMLANQTTLPIMAATTTTNEAIISEQNTENAETNISDTEQENSEIGVETTNIDSSLQMLFSEVSIDLPTGGVLKLSDDGNYYIDGNGLPSGTYDENTEITFEGILTIETDNLVKIASITSNTGELNISKDSKMEIANIMGTAIDVPFINVGEDEVYDDNDTFINVTGQNIAIVAEQLQLFSGTLETVANERAIKIVDADTDSEFSLLINSTAKLLATATGNAGIAIEVESVGMYTHSIVNDGGTIIATAPNGIGGIKAVSYFATANYDNKSINTIESKVGIALDIEQKLEIRGSELTVVTSEGDIGIHAGTAVFDEHFQTIYDPYEEIVISSEIIVTAKDGVGILISLGTDPLEPSFKIFDYSIDWVPSALTVGNATVITNIESGFGILAGRISSRNNLAKIESVVGSGYGVVGKSISPMEQQMGLTIISQANAPLINQNPFFDYLKAIYKETDMPTAAGIWSLEDIHLYNLYDPWSTSPLVEQTFSGEVPKNVVGGVGIRIGTEKVTEEPVMGMFNFYGSGGTISGVGETGIESFVANISNEDINDVEYISKITADGRGIGLKVRDNLGTGGNIFATENSIKLIANSDTTTAIVVEPTDLTSSSVSIDLFDTDVIITATMSAMVVNANISTMIVNSNITSNAGIKFNSPGNSFGVGICGSSEINIDTTNDIGLQIDNQTVKISPDDLIHGFLPCDGEAPEINVTSPQTAILFDNSSNISGDKNTREVTLKGAKITATTTNLAPNIASTSAFSAEGYNTNVEITGGGSLTEIFDEIITTPIKMVGEIFPYAQNLNIFDYESYTWISTKLADTSTFLPINVLSTGITSNASTNNGENGLLTATRVVDDASEKIYLSNGTHTVRVRIVFSGVFSGYTVTYDGNGSDGGAVPTDTTTYLVGDIVTVQAGTQTLTGHTFAGWEYNGTVYAVGDPISMPASNITLTAQWIPIPPPPPVTYTVTYNGNGNDGGAVPTDTTTYLVGDIVTVQAGTQTLTGHTFAGWEYNGTVYAVGDPISMPASNITLTAQWTLIPTYTVTYNGNGNDGGAVPTDTTTYLVGDIVTVQAGTQTLTGHTFVGWEYNGTVYVVGDPISMPASNITLTAQWTPPPITYTVTYDGNGNDGGAAPTDTTTYLVGDIVTVQAGTQTLTGHTFAGWEYDGTVYAVGDPISMPASNITLTAQWTPIPPPPPITYTVTYDGNGNDGGAAPTDTTTYLAGDIVTVQAGTQTLTGHTFVGWEYNGTIYAVGDPISMPTSNITLTAQWTLIPTYTVTYNGNGNDGGAVPTDTTAYLVGDIVTVQAGTQTLTGHTFAGWEYNGIVYAVGSPIPMSATNITLAAQWTPIPSPSPITYTVTYNGNGNDGGVVPTDTTAYLAGDIVTVQAGTQILTGHTFVGWEHNGTTYPIGSIIQMPSTNITLVAKWIPTPSVTYTITYDGNGADGGIIPIDTNLYTSGDTVTVLSGEPIKADHTFVGWEYATISRQNGQIYHAGDIFIMPKTNMKLIAKWSSNQTPLPNTYTVTYHGNGNTGGIIPSDLNNYLAGNRVSILPKIPTKTNYTFVGWEYAGIIYQANDTFVMPNNNVILIAQWTKNTEKPKENILIETGYNNDSGIWGLLTIVSSSILIIFGKNRKHFKK